MNRASCIFFALALSITTSAHAAKVDFDSQGFLRVRGKPFFPIGCWVYNMDQSILADLHEHHFNTVVNFGFKPQDIKLFEAHGLMAIPPATDEFLKLKDSPAVLAWYLEDEPEEHNVAPQDLKKRYETMKAKDKDHPIGVTHDTLHGPAVYKDCSDFTMSDVYPVTADRQWPMNAVGMYTERPREVHGKNWTNLTFVQTFGGPDSDGGKWAQPLPHEVRFMAFDALVHRASGILYFSYWPRGPLTWESITRLNADIVRLVPWLIGEGAEQPASSSNPAVEIRARKVGDSWMIIALNTAKSAQQTTLNVDGVGNATMRRLSDGEPTTWKNGERAESFASYEEKVFLL